MECLEVGTGSLDGRFAAKHVGGALQQLGLPLGDLVGMDIMLLGQFGQGLLATEGGQRHFGLERRRVVPAGTSAHLLLLIPRAYHARIRPPVHLAHCPESRDQLSVNPVSDGVMSFIGGFDAFLGIAGKFGGLFKDTLWKVMGNSAGLVNGFFKYQSSCGSANAAAISAVNLYISNYIQTSVVEIISPLLATCVGGLVIVVGCLAIGITVVIAAQVMAQSLLDKFYDLFVCSPRE